MFTRIPTPDEIQAFLLHLTRHVKGQIEFRSNVTTIETYWHQLERLIRLRLGFKYPGDQRGDIRQVRT